MKLKKTRIALNQSFTQILLCNESLFNFFKSMGKIDKVSEKNLKSASYEVDFILYLFRCYIVLLVVPLFE
ncbi:hypothetical protein LL1119B1_02440 [Lactococcus lactis]|nr:hypothetical protein LL1119B1_02440 [Lactococcus lactis]